MRANTLAIRQAPEYSCHEGTQTVTFRSPSHALAFMREHASTYNERRDDIDEKSSLSWYGLGAQQSLREFYDTGRHNLMADLALKTAATMPAARKVAGRARPAVTGGAWNVPAVIIGLPVAARIRPRTRLAPIHLHFITFMGSVSDAMSIIPAAVKLARAMNAYALAGGQVLAKVTAIALHDADGIARSASTVHFSATDLASTVLALSPAFHRGVQIPMRQAMSVRNHDSLRRPVNWFPNSYDLTSNAGAIAKQFEAACEALKISSTEVQ
jgi:hypothetical protein